MEFAAALPEGAVVVLAAAPLKYKSGAVFHPYRQESNFWYLTGWEEPDSAAVIEKMENDYHFTLFCRPKDEKQEQWMGPWSGLDAARDIFNADESRPIARVGIDLRQILKNAKHLYCDVELGANNLDQTALALKDAKIIPKSASSVLNPIRAVKSDAEIALLKHVGKVSGRALNRIIASKIRSEAQIASLLNWYFCQEGCIGHAYVPVVAGGKRGIFIHWVQNNGMAELTDLMTVDAGAEYGGYVSDITRTWPVSGKFTPAQKDLYEAVLAAQRQAVSVCTEGKSFSLDRLHAFTEDHLRVNLKGLGFDTSGDAIRRLFPHHVGHYVGIDVHDVPGYSKSTPLRQGHCITVEPGVYVPDDERWPKHFRGMGIRIEDDVCVGKDEPTVLTSLAVKEVHDIENLEWTVGSGSLPGDSMLEPGKIAGEEKR